MLALTAVPGWYSLDLDAVCAFISSDLAPGERVSLPHVLSENLAFVDSSWADDKNHRRSFLAYYLFVNNATFSWRATLSQIIALSTAEAELMALASCCCEVV